MQLGIWGTRKRKELSRVAVVAEMKSGSIFDLILLFCLGSGLQRQEELFFVWMSEKDLHLVRFFPLILFPTPFEFQGAMKIFMHSSGSREKILSVFSCMHRLSKNTRSNRWIWSIIEGGIFRNKLLRSSCILMGVCRIPAREPCRPVRPLIPTLRTGRE